MKDEDKSKAQLVGELVALRQQVEELAFSMHHCRTAEQTLRDRTTELEQRLDEQTAALQHSNEQLLAEMAARQQIEKALRSAKDQLKAVLEAAPGIACWIGSDLRYLGVNRHFSKAFGLAPESFVGQEIDFLQTSSEFNEFVREFLASSAQDGCREVTASLNGDIRKYLVVVQKYDRQRAAFVVGVDITGRSGTEDALQCANEALEKQVEESTAALQAATQGLTDAIDERQRVEAALRALEAERKALFAAIPDAIAVLDAEGRYLSVVSTASQGLHPPESDPVGKTIHDLLPIAQADLILNHIRLALESQRTVSFEYSLPIANPDRDNASALANAESIHEARFMAHISPMPDDRVIWVARDITQQKQAENALRQAEDQYRSIFEHTAVGLFQASFDGRCLSVNPAIARMYGYASPEAFIAKVNDIGQRYVIPDRCAEWVAALKQTGSVSNFESQVYRQDGSIIWVSETVRIVHDAEGKPLYYEGTVEDITQRKQIEDAFAESQRTLSMLMGNLPGIIYRRHNDSCWTMKLVSNGCHELTGYPPEALIDNHTVSYAELIHPDDRKLVAECVQSAIETDCPFQMVYRILTPTGDQKWVWEQGQVIRSPEEESVVIEGFISDITERKRVEMALQAEQQESERLLLNIVPAAIANQLKQSIQPIAQRFEDATILFADIADFTSASAQLAATELVGLLNEIFSTFDYLTEWHDLEKIKTIGDAYMVAAGVPTPREDHIEAIAEMALDMQQAISYFQREGDQPFTLRIGIHTGPVVAGVIGVKKFIYDVWGDTVNVASRMETQGLAGGIQVTHAIYSRLKDKYDFEVRGAIFVKGWGEMTTYWLQGRKDDRSTEPMLSSDTPELIPSTPMA